MKKIITLILAVCLIIPCTFVLSACFKTENPPENKYAWADVADTSWFVESENEFILTTAEQLAGLAQLVNAGKNFDGKTVKLGADINLAGRNWTPIGNMYGEQGQNDGISFLGIFDGQNHKITNLVCKTNALSGKNFASGLFGKVGNHAKGNAETVAIKNLTVDGATIEGNHYVAVVVAHAMFKNMSNIIVRNAEVKTTYANVDASGDKAGALIGFAKYVQLNECDVYDCTISADRDAGQLIGSAYTEVQSEKTVISNCTATRVNVVCNNTGAGIAGSRTGENIKNYFVGSVGPVAVEGNNEPQE